ncbi:hypothetical protein [Lampropedia puyangensis]|uniref:hypothetical protein n=1 Tax=Lampropedia puyangensis TaxID=1330072 RepID=UPI00130524E6|nr:hypothetical protein [Lampropedia puyangensis]
MTWIALNGIKPTPPIPQQAMGRTRQSLVCGSDLIAFSPSRPVAEKLNPATARLYPDAV